MTLPARYKPTGATFSGGMGDIITCTDLNLGRQVVVKKLQLGEERRRIIDEQKALMGLRSKHVIQILDILELSNHLGNEVGLVLEFIDGGDLSIASFDPGAHYLSTLWQIACGLKDIHDANVIHRDIKPNNIRLDSEGVIRILDFGLARTIGPEAKTRGAVGTPTFMAPELYKTKIVSFDKSIDVYAFAVTALSLLKVSLPRELCFEPPKIFPPGRIEYLAAEASVSGNIFKSIPNDIRELLQKSLSYRPENRPTISDIKDALARQLTKDSHRALVITQQGLSEISSQRRRVRVNLGASLAIEIHYDGYNFIISSLTGEVSINNTKPTIGQILPPSCVIGFTTGTQRRFVTFDVSHPEIFL